MYITSQPRAQLDGIDSEGWGRLEWGLDLTRESGASGGASCNGALCLGEEWDEGLPGSALAT